MLESLIYRTFFLECAPPPIFAFWSSRQRCPFRFDRRGETFSEILSVVCWSGSGVNFARPGFQAFSGKLQRCRRIKIRIIQPILPPAKQDALSSAQLAVASLACQPLSAVASNAKHGIAAEAGNPVFFLVFF